MSIVEKVVLVPRFTAFVEPQTLRTSPIDVRDFARAELTGWRGEYFGTGTLFKFSLEESVDLLSWTPIAASAIALAARTEDTVSCEFEKPWVRVVVTLAGSPGCAATSWLVGNFTRRDR